MAPPRGQAINWTWDNPGLIVQMCCPCSPFVAEEVGVNAHKTNVAVFTKQAVPFLKKIIAANYFAALCRDGNMQSANGQSVVNSPCRPIMFSPVEREKCKSGILKFITTKSSDQEPWAVKWTQLRMTNKDQHSGNAWHVDLTMELWKCLSTNYVSGSNNEAQYPRASFYSETCL